MAFVTVSCMVVTHPMQNASRADALSVLFPIRLTRLGCDMSFGRSDMKGFDMKESSC